jgi:putative addiction module killer protein
VQYELETLDAFDRWFDGLSDPIGKQAIRNGLVKLSAGLFGNVEPVGSGVSEYKIDVGPGYRAYFITRQRRLIIMLCGGDKSTQRADIKEAKRLAAGLGSAPA